MRTKRITGLILACFSTGACSPEPTAESQTAELAESAEAASMTTAAAGGPEPGGAALEGAAMETDGTGSCGAPLDTNQNGLVELAEYNSFSGFSFDNWDDDDNGEVSQLEFHSCWRALGWGDSTSAFRAFNDDGEAGLEHEEFFGRGEFKLWDKNQDGALGRGEFL